MAAEKAPVVNLPVTKTEMTNVDSPNGNPIISGLPEGEAFDSVRNMADLKEKAPEVYQAMMQGIGMNICREMQKHQKRFREILKKARDNAA